jgi:hypothetical protein
VLFQVTMVRASRLTIGGAGWAASGILGTAIAVIALLPSGAAAWTQPESVSGLGAGSERVAATPDGGALAAWIRPVGSGEYNFESRALAADRTLSPVQRISSAAGAGDMEVDANGRAIFVWRTDDGIQTRDRAPDGTLGPVRTICSASGFLPQVAVNAAGDAAFVWLRREPSPRVQARLESADGTLGPLRTLSKPLTDPSYADVGIDSTGKAVFLWSGQMGFEARAVSTNGTMSPIQGVSPPHSTASNLPADLAVDPAGRAAFTWQRYTARNYQVQARTRAPNGHLGPVETMSTPPQSAFEPRVAVVAGGDALVAWASSGVLARTLSPADTLGPIQRVAGPGSSSPRVDSDSGGNAVIAWLRYADTSDSHIQARVRGADGTLQPTHNFATNHRATAPEVDVDPTGHAAIAWVSHFQGDADFDHVMASVGP